MIWAVRESLFAKGDEVVINDWHGSKSPIGTFIGINDNDKINHLVICLEEDWHATASSIKHKSTDISEETWNNLRRKS